MNIIVCENFPCTVHTVFICYTVKTCLEGPLKRPSNCGLFRQVVLMERCNRFALVVPGAVCSGHYGQVVLLRR